MKALDETLSDRVDDLIRTHRRQRLLSTTGSQTALAELAARMEGLEKAVREIALEIQRSRVP
jgi:predicted sugar kinase